MKSAVTRRSDPQSWQVEKVVLERGALRLRQVVQQIAFDRPELYELPGDPSLGPAKALQIEELE